MLPVPPAVKEPPKDFTVTNKVMYPGDRSVLNPPYGPKLLTLSDLYNSPDGDDWMMSELYCRGELVVLFGDGGSGKSFIAIDHAMALALGCNWCGNRFVATTPRKVVYTVGEGWRGIKKRFFALDSEYGRRGIDTSTALMYFVPHVPQLFDSSSIYTPKEFIVHLSRHGCAAPDVIIIDTLQRAGIAADENSSRDIGIILGNLSYIQRETNAAIFLIHHANKGGGIRGNTALRNSADVVLCVEKMGQNSHLMKCDKVKDADFFNPIPFSFYPAEFSSVIDWSSDGKTVNTGSDAERVLRFLSDHPGEEYTAKEAAYAANVSPTHMTRISRALGQLLSTRRENPSLPASSKNLTLYRYSEQTQEEK